MPNDVVLNWLQTHPTPLTIKLLVLLIAIQCLCELWPLFRKFSILPRSLGGFVGIPFAPFVHHSWQHLIMNAIPFVVLGLLIELQSQNTLLITTVIIGLVAGFGTWTFGRKAYHAGSSSLIFGYLSYLVGFGIMHASMQDSIIAWVAVFLYSGLFLTVFEIRRNVSWSGHFFGMVGGVVALPYASVFKKLLFFTI